MEEAEAVSLSPALVVDDDEAMQQRLGRLLAGLGVAPGDIVFAGNLAAARSCLSARGFSLVLVDIGLPDGSGVELLAWMRSHGLESAALVVSAWGHEEVVLAALRAGAIGYLLKERDDDELLVSLRSIARGGAPIDPTIARGILALLRPMPAGPQSTPALSEREGQVLNLVARGYSNREIADMTELSRFTIEGYTKSIYRKLAVGSRTAAVFEAKAMGLLP